MSFDKMSLTVSALVFFVMLLVTLKTNDGHLDASSVNRIVGGSKADKALTKSVVQLTISFPNEKKKFICSGTIISKLTILTAAHCFFHKGSNPTLISISSKGLSTLSESELHVQRAYVHKTFDIHTLLNDVAVIELQKSLRKGSYVSMEVPVSSSPALKNKEVVFAAGYGLDSMGNLGTLNQVELITWDFLPCSPYKKEGTKVSEKTSICATAPSWPNGEKGICGGDSGGPLFVKRRSGLFVYGIASFGPDDCGEKGAVGWYAKVSNYYLEVVHPDRYYTYWDTVYDGSAQ